MFIFFFCFLLFSVMTETSDEYSYIISSVNTFGQSLEKSMISYSGSNRIAISSVFYFLIEFVITDSDLTKRLCFLSSSSEFTSMFLFRSSSPKGDAFGFFKLMFSVLARLICCLIKSLFSIVVDLDGVVIMSERRLFTDFLFFWSPVSFITFSSPESVSEEIESSVIDDNYDIYDYIFDFFLFLY